MKIDLERIKKFSDSLRYDPEKQIAAIVIRTIEAGIVEDEAVIDDKQLDEITAQNNNRVNDCMALVMKLFCNGVIDTIQAIMLVRVIENVSLVDAKEIVDAWKKDAPNPDPILDVYEKYKDFKTRKKLNIRDGSFAIFGEDCWQAIEKYAKARERK